VFCIPRLIRTKDNALLDITADVDYKTSGQVADDGKVFMPNNGHGVMIAKYFMPFFTAREYGETTFISLSGLNLSIDNVEYVDNVATLTVSPPLRRNINEYDLILTEPYFTGNISNGAELKTLYEASNVGHIQTNRIIFQEVVI